MNKNDAHIQAQMLLKEMECIGTKATIYHAKSANTYYVNIYRFEDNLVAFPYDKESHNDQKRST